MCIEVPRGYTRTESHFDHLKNVHYQMVGGGMICGAQGLQRAHRGYVVIRQGCRDHFLRQE